MLSGKIQVSRIEFPRRFEYPRKLGRYVGRISIGNEITGPLYGRLHETKEGRNDGNVPADRFWRSLAV